MKTTNLPIFQGKPIIPQDLPLPQADFLRDAFGHTVLEEFQGRVKADYQGNTNIDVLSYDKKENIVKGSTPFAVMLVNAIVAQQEHRTASQADLEAILSCNALPFRGTYEEGSLVLRPEDTRYVALHLRKQVQARQKIDGPVMVYLHDFTAPQTDAASEYGLVCQLKENAQLIPAPQLAHTNNRRRFTKTDTHGLPIFDEQGTRTLYTCPRLSRVYLNRDLGLLSYVDGLGLSFSNGRVVVVSGEVASQKFQDYVAQLTAKNAEEEQELATRFQQAMNLFLQNK